AEEACGLEAFLGRQGVRRFERRAFDWIKEVDGHGVDLEPAGRVSEIKDVLIALAHPDDPTRTGREPGGAHVGDRLDAVVIGVGRADAGIEAAAGVEVVVYPSGTRALQLLGLFQGQKTNR